MSEARLGATLTARFGRLLSRTLAGYAALVIAVFAALSELALRSSLEHSADVVESLLGLYADPGGARTTVAPDMLADQLLGMGEPFLITRTMPSSDGGRTIYFLSPTMPAKEVRPWRPGATPEEVSSQLARMIAQRGRWRHHVLHRRAGEFDLFVAGSRLPYALALVGIGSAALFLLPLAAWLARQATGRAVANTLAPLARVIAETQDIGPGGLSKRVRSPTGLGEVTELAEVINRLVDRVERSHRALEGFTADASHELRTPLAHLRAQAQWALEEHRSPDAMREALAAISREVERTTKMAEDLLLIARGENRQLVFERQELDLASLTREVAEITEAMAAGRDLLVRTTVNGPLLAVGDPSRTRQILLNLASNAVRYTTVGTVTFELVREGARAGVAVRDTGCGIAPEHLERIFDRFYRVDTSRSRMLGGAGLGLTIARLLAELQGGSIAVESRPGRGTTFVLWLPTAD